MGRLQKGKQLLATGIMGGMLLAGTLAYADAPAAKWYDTIGISGYSQASYVGNLNKPTNAAGQKLDNTGRVFDTDSNGFAFNTFLLQIAKPVGDSDHYGFTTRLRMGHDAQVLNGNSNTLFVQEAYMTYNVPSLSKLNLIGGRFVTPEGFEGVDTVNNPNFSEGLLFGYAEPVTHTGIKANYTISDKANATIGLVNGWDNTNASDNNTAKTILWQLATTPMKALSWSFQGLYGKELSDPTNSQRLSLDTVATYTMDKFSLSGQANWGQETNVALGGGANGPNTNHWDGLGVWLSYATNAMFTESARFEVLADENGANRFGAGTFANGTTNQTVKEFTLTHKTMLASNLGTRLEFRHDWSNEPYFAKHSDGGTNNAVKNQNTISADVFVTF